MSVRPTAQSKIYDNCKMYSRDGVFLAICSSRRKNWYLKKGLATAINDHDFKLTFEQKGDGHVNDIPYMLEKKENRCVICGTSEGLTLHHIVPSCYRKLFPEEYKCSNHFDVVCACEICHDDYEKKAFLLKKQLIDQFAPERSVYVPSVEERNKDRARGAIFAIRKYYAKMPEDRKQHLFKILSEYFSQAVTIDNFEHVVQESEFQDSLSMKKKRVGEPDVQIKASFEGFLKEGGHLFSFIVMWRRHFVDTAQPKFLSPNWLENYKTRIR